MSEAKQELIRLIKQQPAGGDMEDVLREVAFHLMILRGLADVDAGRVMSRDEVARRMREWFDEAQSKSQREE